MRAPLFVVEGNADLARLQLINVKYAIKTDGFCVSRETIFFINASLKVRPVIILTDPDGPGYKIASRLLEECPGVIVISDFKASEAKKNGRVGIAYIPVDLLKERLREYLPPYDIEEELTIEDLDFIKSDAKPMVLKHILIEHYHLWSTSLKSVLKGLNILGVSLSEVKEALGHE